MWNYYVSCDAFHREVNFKRELRPMDFPFILWANFVWRKFIKTLSHASFFVNKTQDEAVQDKEHLWHQLNIIFDVQKRSICQCFNMQPIKLKWCRI